MRCLNTKGKYGKVTNAEIKWSIISKSVMIDIFVEFIDQLIDYSINRASPNQQPNSFGSCSGMTPWATLLHLIKSEDDDLAIHVSFNIIFKRQWRGDHERLCSMKYHSVMSKILAHS